MSETYLFVKGIFQQLQQLLGAVALPLGKDTRDLREIHDVERVAMTGPRPDKM